MQHGMQNILMTNMGKSMGKMKRNWNGGNRRGKEYLFLRVRRISIERRTCSTQMHLAVGKIGENDDRTEKDLYINL